MDELPHVLWTYRTTPRRSTVETPFSMTYSIEAVIPLEVIFSTIRTSQFNIDENARLLLTGLDLVEERKEVATVQMAHYQQKLKQGYQDKSVCAKGPSPKKSHREYQESSMGKNQA